MKKAALFALAALTPLLSFAADQADFTFPAGMVYTLSAEPAPPTDGGAVLAAAGAEKAKPASSVRINCSPAAGVNYDEGGFVATVRDVVYSNDNRAQGLAEKFRPEFKWDRASKLGPRLLFKSAAPLSPGSYVVTLDLEMKIKGSSAANPADRTYVQALPPITLQVPAPQISAPSLVRVDRVYFWPGVAETPIYYLTETSGKSSLTGATLVDASEPTATEDVPGAQLTAADFKGEVPAGQRVPIVFTPTTRDPNAEPGRFPLGTTNGRLSLKGPELATPITIPYVVRTRLARWTIGAVAALGIVFGWFVRTRLQKQKETAAANAAASRQLAALNEALEQTPDEPFRHAVTLALGNFDHAAKPDAAALATASAAAAQALTSAETELQNRRQALQQEFSLIAQALTVRSDFPPAATDLVREILPILARVKSDVEQRNVQAAQDLFQSLREQKLLDLVHALDQWQKESASYLARLVKHPPATTQGGIALLTKVATAADLEAGGLPDARQAIAIADVPGLLAAAHTARSRARALTVQLQAATEELLAAMRVNLSSRLSNPAVLEPLFDASTRAVNSLSTDLDAPSEAAKDLVRRHAEVVNAWDNSLSAAAPTNTNLKPVKEALTNNDWEGAMTKAASLLPPPLAASTPLNAIEPSVAPAPPTFSFQSQDRKLAGAVLERQGEAMQFGHAHLQGTEAEAQQFDKKARFAGALQSACFGVISIAVAYGLYSAKWVGTPQECLVLFFWGFGLDITADAVLTATRQVK